MSNMGETAILRVKVIVSTEQGELPTPEEMADLLEADLKTRFLTSTPGWYEVLGVYADGEWNGDLSDGEVDEDYL